MPHRPDNRWRARDAVLQRRPLEDDLTDFFQRPAWHAQAACRGMGWQLFFVERGESVQPAKAVCEGCPVQAQCLDAGHRENYGIWGGQSPEQRSLGRPRGRRVARCGTDGGYFRHRNLGENACGPCTTAHNGANRMREARRTGRLLEARGLVLKLVSVAPRLGEEQEGPLKVTARPPIIGT